MDTIKKLSDYAILRGHPTKFLGVPKTIDNDLALTDHTPGYGSAAKYIGTSVKEIIQDSQALIYDKGLVTIVEIMGRHAGWLTAASRLARKYEGDNPCLIYLPETPFSLEQFYNDLDAAFKKSPNLVVCVSEGIADEAAPLSASTPTQRSSIPSVTRCSPAAVRSWKALSATSSA